MKLFTNKLVILSPIIVLAVVLIFGLTLAPNVSPTPKNLPIAFVNEDEGVEIPNQGTMNMGEKIAEMVQQHTAESTTEEDPAIHLIIVNSYEEVKEGLNQQEYYAALTIPKDFSQNQMSLQTSTPTSPEIEILVNQGMNTLASTMAGQMLNGIVDNINQNVRTQILEGFEKQGGTLTTKQATALVSPITKKVTNVNEIGTASMNGNAPISLFQPLWMASIAGAVIMFLMTNKLTFTNRKDKLLTKLMQFLMGAVLAIFAGFGLTWIADALGIHIPKFSDTALFLSISYFAFFLMISAVLSWLGIRGIPIFVIILFFGGPLLAMAPELMSTFYRDWIFSWLPMRFMVEGLRELFFFGKGLSWSQPTSILVWIGIVSFVVMLVSVVKPNNKKEVEVQTNF
jgi:YhgE/Pip-like protein